MNINFVRHHKNAVTPSKAKPGDAGFDLTAVSYNYVEDTESPYHNYEFGISIEIPYGYVGFICPRSSNSKTDLVLANGIGVLDSSFRGTISARFKEIVRPGEKQSPELFKVGQRVAQLVIIPCPEFEFHEVGKLTSTERGEGGFGSSGR